MPWYYQELTSKIIAAAIEVHKHLGPGLLEIAYQTCLAAELEALQLAYQRDCFKERDSALCFRRER